VCNFSTVIVECVSSESTVPGLSLDTHSTITVVEKHADDASGDVEQVSIFYVNVPESTQSCDS